MINTNTDKYFILATSRFFVTVAPVNRGINAKYVIRDRQHHIDKDFAILPDSGFHGAYGKHQAESSALRMNGHDEV